MEKNFNGNNFNTSDGVGLYINDPNEVGEPTFFIYPNDMSFIENITKMYRNNAGIQSRADARKKEVMKALNASNEPFEGAEVAIQALKDEIDETYTQIDLILGGGVCRKIFGDKYNLFLIGEFMEFITAKIKEHRKSTIDKYMNRNERRAAQKNGLT